MNLRDIKKDIEYVVGAFVDDCALFLTVNPGKNADEIADLVDKAVDLYNDLRDKVNAPAEGNKKAHYNAIRKEMLEAIRYVDMVIPEENWEQKKTDVEKYDIDVFVMGNDWEGKFDFLKDQCEVVYLPRTPEISTTKIKEDLNDKPV